MGCCWWHFHDIADNLDFHHHSDDIADSDFHHRRDHKRGRKYQHTHRRCLPGLVNLWCCETLAFSGFPLVLGCADVGIEPVLNCMWFADRLACSSAACLLLLRHASHAFAGPWLVMALPD